MAISPSSSVQRARQDLADRLRDLRLDAGLTARALSGAAGWHEAKTSRIESGKQALSENDLRIWCQVCGVPDHAVDLIAASRAADSMYTEWRRMHRTGLRREQVARRSLYERTQMFKIYVSTVMPGLIQTPAYAKALMSAITAFQGTPDDVEAAVRARMERNRVLRSVNHQFVMLLEESVLRYQIGDAEVMAGQLGHVLNLVALPNVRLGIVPFSASQRDMWTLEAFTAFDDARVHVELLSAQVTVTAPGEVVIYLRAFERLTALAVYGAEARALISDAISVLGSLPRKCAQVLFLAHGALRQPVATTFALIQDQHHEKPRTGRRTPTRGLFMPGLHAQLTTTELTSALDAAETLLKLEPYIDRMTYTKISTLHADLATEQEDRQRIADANSR